MYFLNPVLIFGLVALVLAGAMLGWRQMSKTEYMRLAADTAVRTIGVWGLLFVLLGGILGFSHSLSHPRCLDLKAAGGDIQGCQYFFDHYGE